MRAGVLLSVAVLVLAGASAVAAESFPSVPVTTLGGKQLELPGALSGHPSILVIGFTQAAEKQTSVWRKRVQKELAGSQGLVVYPVIVIQQIPGIFHGLLIAGIRAGVPRSMWAHFLVVDHAAAAWKAAIGWKGSNLAYLVLLDAKGGIAWKRSGGYSPEGEASLRARLATLGEAPAASR